MKQWILAAAVALGAAACGGGGGDAPPPNDFPSDPVVIAARSAQVRAVSKPASSQAELSWTDLMDAETGFRIDRWVNGAWGPVVTLPASPGTGKALSWTGDMDAVSTPYRVVALLAAPRSDGSREIELRSSNGQTLLVGITSANAAIALSRPDPLKGDVVVSVTAAPEAQAVEFYVDQNNPKLPVSGPRPTFEAAWNTAKEANGSHKITAFVGFGPDSFVMLERVVNVAN